MENQTIPQNMPTFATKEEAFDWMVERVDDDCIDNYRFAFLDDMEAMVEYERKANTGCCGSADYNIMVDGRRAAIGCNYGH